MKKEEGYVDVRYSLVLVDGDDYLYVGTSYWVIFL